MNIYVANLNFSMGDEDLRSVFEQYGTVDSAKIISDHFSGKSRGFGFVEMPNDSEANNAINELNEAEVEGKVLAVKEARPREEMKKPFNRSGGGGGGFGGGDRRGGGGGFGGGDRRGGGGYGGDRRGGSGYGGGDRRGGGGYDRSRSNYGGYDNNRHNY